MDRVLVIDLSLRAAGISSVQLAGIVTGGSKPAMT
jgi:hypothetical protein